MGPEVTPAACVRRIVQAMAHSEDDSLNHALPATDPTQGDASPASTDDAAMNREETVTSAVRRSDSETQVVRDAACHTARLLADLHCSDVLVFDVRGLSPVTDYLLIASGTSDRQLKSCASRVAELGRERGLSRYGVDRDDETMWVVIDFVELVVHLFEPAMRGHYDLEMLWDDAPRVRWRDELAAESSDPRSSANP